MELIPAIDLIDNSCVRLLQGDYAKKTTYSKNPLDVAKGFQDLGFKKLHLVDLDGAKAKQVKHFHILESITSNTNLKVDFSGGIRNKEDIENSFNAGANQVSLGSIAVKEPDFFINCLNNFNPEKIILSADVKNNLVAISGWEEDTEIELTSFVQKFYEKKLQYLICTDISKDGMLEGSNIKLYQELKSNFKNLHVIASGGVGSYKDLKDLREAKIESVILGKALYEEKISTKELEEFLC